MWASGTDDGKQLLLFSILDTNIDYCMMIIIESNPFVIYRLHFRRS